MLVILCNLTNAFSVEALDLLTAQVFYQTQYISEEEAERHSRLHTGQHRSACSVCVCTDTLLIQITWLSKWIHVNNV